jgi:hypothetical protein
LLTVEELSAWWGVSVAALNAARQDGTGPPFLRLLGGEHRHGVVRYEFGECLDYMQSHTVTSTSDPGPEKLTVAT